MTYEFGGEPFVLQPLTNEDRPRLQQFLEHLPVADLVERFGTKAPRDIAVSCCSGVGRFESACFVLKNKGGGIAAFCKIDMHILPSDTSRLIAYGHKIDRYTREEYCRLSVTVANRFRRKGMGRALFWAMVSFAQAGDKKFMLISDGVTDKNTAGCAYCRAMGFKGLGKFSDLEGKSRVDGILPLYK